jgi:hypothetical protein
MAGARSRLFVLTYFSGFTSSHSLWVQFRNLGGAPGPLLFLLKGPFSRAAVAAQTVSGGAIFSILFTTPLPKDQDDGRLSPELPGSDPNNVVSQELEGLVASTASSAKDVVNPNELKNSVGSPRLPGHFVAQAPVWPRHFSAFQSLRLFCSFFHSHKYTLIATICFVCSILVFSDLQQTPYR